METFNSHTHRPLARKAKGEVINRLLTRRQVADLLGVCTDTVARYAKAGLLKEVRINNRMVRYPTNSIETLLSQKEVA